MTATTLRLPKPSDLMGLDGAALAPSDWVVVEQEHIDSFAHATGDHQWIHVDPERAATGPFGATVAHGYLSLSLLAPLFVTVLGFDRVSMGVNYGLDKVRFPAPVRVGSKVRFEGRLLDVNAIPGGVQLRVSACLVLQGSEKPAVIAVAIYRFLD